MRSDESNFSTRNGESADAPCNVISAFADTDGEVMAITMEKIKGDAENAQ